MTVTQPDFIYLAALWLDKMTITFNVIVNVNIQCYY